ncbi:hypothetical protein BDZ91DRAFT_727913 [Kalaharituber pfeilii]|nr:hypothetical protein BDZ91DRAFT_727913 [Kalaharituber pfeilii]
MANPKLSVLHAANEELDQDIANGRISEKRVEDVGEDEERYIEMNLGLGVLEEKRPKSRKRRRRAALEESSESKATTTSSTPTNRKAVDVEATPSDDATPDPSSSSTSDSDSNTSSESDSESGSSASESNPDSGSSEEEEEEEEEEGTAHLNAFLNILNPLLTLSIWRIYPPAPANEKILAALLNIDAERVSVEGERAGIEIIEDGANEKMEGAVQK